MQIEKDDVNILFYFCLMCFLRVYKGYVIFKYFTTKSQVVHILQTNLPSAIPALVSLLCCCSVVNSEVIRVQGTDRL